MRLFTRSTRRVEAAREPEKKIDLPPIKDAEEEKWDRRRWELVRYLVAQDRRSVVLGKLEISDKAIARKARQLADAAIRELRTHKYGCDEEQG